VVALTTFDADELVRQAINAGAVGYLVKDTPPAEIINAVRAVASGQGVLSPAVTRPLLDLARDAAAAGRSQPRCAAIGHAAVSPLTWLSTGQSTGEAIPIALSTSRTWNGQSSTVSALTMVDWER
jgi:DNA-binding NarL/FixJ family response regulator